MVALVSCTSSGADTIVRWEGVFHAPLVSGSFSDTVWAHVHIGQCVPTRACMVQCVQVGFLVVYHWFWHLF